MKKYRKNVLTACFWKRTEMFMKEKIEKLKSSQGNGESKEIQEPANGTGTAKKKSGLAREGIAYLIFGVLTTVIDYVI